MRVLFCADATLNQLIYNRCACFRKTWCTLPNRAQCRHVFNFDGSVPKRVTNTKCCWIALSTAVKIIDYNYWQHIYMPDRQLPLIHPARIAHTSLMHCPVAAPDAGVDASIRCLLHTAEPACPCAAAGHCGPRAWGWAPLACGSGALLDERASNGSRRLDGARQISNVSSRRDEVNDRIVIAEWERERYIACVWTSRSVSK